MFEILTEKTIWSCDYEVPNHTYLFDSKGNALAYFNSRIQKMIVLKTPLKIDRRYRKFVKSDNKELLEFSKTKQNKPNKDERVFQVKSKDNTYLITVNKNKIKCSCLGFNFKGKCKHIQLIKDKL